MLRSVHFAPSVYESHQEPDLAGPFAQPTGFSSWPIATKLRTVWDALREGITAHRQYENLRWRGIPPDTAIRQALGIPHPGKRTPHRKIQGGIKAIAQPAVQHERAVSDRSPRCHHRSTRDASKL